MIQGINPLIPDRTPGRDSAGNAKGTETRTGQDLRSASDLKPGQVVDALVEKILSPTRAEVTIGGRHLLAETSLLLTPGDQIRLKVLGEGQGQVLKLIVPETDSLPGPLSSPPSLASLLGTWSRESPFSGLFKLLAPMLSSASSSQDSFAGLSPQVSSQVFKNLTAVTGGQAVSPVRADMEQLKLLLVSLTLLSGKADSTLVPRILEKGGLSWENKLFQQVMGNTSGQDPAVIKTLSSQDLKGLAMKLIGELGTNAAQGIDTIRKFVDTLAGRPMTGADHARVREILETVLPRISATPDPGESIRVLAGNLKTLVRPAAGSGPAGSPPLSAGNQSALSSQISGVENDVASWAGSLRTALGKAGTGVMSQAQRTVINQLSHILPGLAEYTGLKSGSPAMENLSRIQSFLVSLRADDSMASMPASAQIRQAAQDLVSRFESDTVAVLRGIRTLLGTGAPSIPEAVRKTITGDILPRMSLLSGSGQGVTALAARLTELLQQPVSSQASTRTDAILVPETREQILSLISSVETENTKTLNALKGFVDAIETFQSLNHYSAESGRYLIPFPIFSQGAFSFGQILFDAGRESGSGQSGKKRLFRVSLLLTLSALGGIRVDCSVLDKAISGRFLVSDSGTGAFVTSMLPDLVKRLSAQGFTVTSMDCQVAPQEKLDPAALVDTLVQDRDKSRMLNIII
ncbi:MAG: flagellar hook-length control protein FliK [Pseudomonadota bacterium]